MQGHSIMSENERPIKTCDDLEGRGHKTPDGPSAQLPHAHAATSFLRSQPEHGRAIPTSEATEMDKFSGSSAEVWAVTQLETHSFWGFLTNCDI